MVGVRLIQMKLVTLIDKIQYTERNALQNSVKLDRQVVQVWKGVYPIHTIAV